MKLSELLQVMRITTPCRVVDGKRDFEEYIGSVAVLKKKAHLQDREIAVSYISDNILVILI